MPAYIKFDGIDGEAWRPYPGASSLAAEVRRAHPQGVDRILIGLLKSPGYRVVQSRRGGVRVAVGDVNGDGVCAILIGLLLPAVQALQADTSADRRILCGVLGSGAQLGFAMADGSVRGAPGSHSGPLTVQHLPIDALLLGPRSVYGPASGQATGRRT